MDIQLGELLDKIRREGVDPARTEAARIVAEAEERKKAIIADAEREAASLIAKARADASRTEDAGKAALAQASRDLLLAFKERIQALLDSLVAMETAQAYSSDVLAQAVIAVVSSMASGGDVEFSVLLPPGELRKLENHFSEKLASELKKGLEIKPHSGIAAGFRIAQKDGSAYYDFSADSVAQLLSRHVNSRLAETLRSAAKGM